MFLHPLLNTPKTTIFFLFWGTEISVCPSDGITTAETMTEICAETYITGGRTVKCSDAKFKTQGAPRWTPQRQVKEGQNFKIKAEAMSKKIQFNNKMMHNTSTWLWKSSSVSAWQRKYVQRCPPASLSTLKSRGIALGWQITSCTVLRRIKGRIRVKLMMQSFPVRIGSHQIGLRRSFPPNSGASRDPQLCLGCQLPFQPTHACLRSNCDSTFDNLNDTNCLNADRESSSAFLRRHQIGSTHLATWQKKPAIAYTTKKSAR